MWFTKLFALIELVLELLKLKDQFFDWYVEKNSAEIEKRAQKRDAAIDKSKTAESEDDIWKSQEDIIDNGSRP